MTTNQDWLARYKEVMVPNYAPKAMVPVRGQGARVWDAEGKEYLDFTGGIAVLGLGHCHETVVAALEKQAHQLWHVSNYFANPPAIELAELFCQLTFAEKVFFANSGSEVNEAALKLARRYAWEKYGEHKNKIISFHQSFHGRSLFTVTAGGQEEYRKGFGPLPPQMLYSIHNDLDQLKEVMDDQCCAVIMEPIMAEGGLHSMDQKFAQGVRDLCDQHKALLIFDEVQTGMGRTGDLFAYQGLGVIPDILTTAKALGSGFPIGAMMTKTHIANSFQPGTHGSTFGGNPLATAVAKATLEIISQKAVLEGIRQKSAFIIQELNRINQEVGLFEAIRGKGLLIGCPLKPETNLKSPQIIEAALQEGLLVLAAGASVVRFAPSLLIEQAEIEQGLQIFAKVLSQVKAS